MSRQASFLPKPKNHALLEHAAKLRRKAERRRLLAEPCDVGLFGHEHLQTDLVDLVKATPPERPQCLKGQCHSPTACAAFGYCRERNQRRR
jgi:hypothetical protein